MGDIGTHAEHLARYVTDLDLSRLCADVSTFVEGRQVDDDADVLLQFDGGARGVLHCSQVALGEENGLRLRLYGTEASLAWRQEEPNALLVRSLVGPDRILRRGRKGCPLHSDDARERPPRRLSCVRPSEGFKPSEGSVRLLLRVRLHRRAGVDEVAVAVSVVHAAHARPELVRAQVRGGIIIVSGHMGLPYAMFASPRVIIGTDPTSPSPMPHPYLSKAPVLEALLDFRVRRRMDLDAAGLIAQADASLGNRFPTRQEIQVHESVFSISLSDTAQTSVSTSLQGVRYESQPSSALEGKRVIQIRTDGLTYSILAPYSQWEVLSSEAIDTWRIYEKISRPESIVRIATRFINRVDLPRSENPSTFIEAAPALPERLRASLDGFSERRLITMPGGFGAIIGRESLPPLDSVVPLLFDIDVFWPHSSPEEIPLPADPSELISIIARLREIKNILFFDSFTQKGIDLYR